MNRQSKRSAKQENYEHVLMCLICRSLFDDHDHQPKFLPCHHTFCKECLREYVRQLGDDIECPSCRKVATIPAAGVAALQTNFYAKYIQSLVYGCGAGGEGLVSECGRHPNQKLQYLCRDCVQSVCSSCLKTEGCANHKLVPLTTATEDYHQKIDASFASGNSLIERKKVELEALLKALSEEKDQSLLKIESTFEQYVHTLNRRATLLKNKVIDIYNEHTAKLDADLEEISTAMTCIVSLKEYHETMISKGDFTDVEKGIDELTEVCKNIEDRIQPQKSQIRFEDRHGTDKFRGCVKDLGRVICKSVAATAEKSEGGEASDAAIAVAQSPLVSPNKVSDVDEMDSENGSMSSELLSKKPLSVVVEAGAEALNCSAMSNADASIPKEIKTSGTLLSEYEKSGQQLTREELKKSPAKPEAVTRVNNNELCKIIHTDQSSSKREAGNLCESIVQPEYWVPTSGSLDAINAEMSSEQTSL